MKAKQFLKMCDDDCCEIEIIKDKEKVYNGDIKKYLENKKSLNGTMKSWDIYVENWDYPVLQIEIE